MIIDRLKTLLKQALPITVALVAIIGPWPTPTQAAELTGRSINIGTSQPSASTTHRYNFTISTVSVLGSIEVEYCSNSPLIAVACIAPTGFDIDSATLSAQTGETGFSIHVSTNANRLVLTRAPAADSAQAVTYTMSGVINPSDSATSYYVRTSTFASNDATGPRVDSGAVVFSTSGALGTSGFVPPYLTFCVGLTVNIDCSGTSGSSSPLGTLLPSQTATTTSQFSAATNDVTGYLVYISGTTMTSGNNIITPMLNSGSVLGSSQFGINLRDNSSPDIGTNPEGVGTGVPTGNYNLANIFRFVNGEAIAGSAISSDFTRQTVSYIVNVDDNQPGGIYSTTLTYIAIVASF